MSKTEIALEPESVLHDLFERPERPGRPATMIHLAHDQAEAMRLADNIVLLRAGRTERPGRPMEIHDDPDSGLVAGACRPRPPPDGVPDARVHGPLTAPVRSAG